MLAAKLLSVPFVGAQLEFVGGRAEAKSSASATPSYSLTSLTGGLASAPSIGDIVIACVTLANTTDLNITCSGYTEVADLYANGSTGDSQLGVFYKVLTAADTTVQFGLSVSDTSCGAIHVWRNQNATPLDATTTTTTNTSNSTPNSPSITTVTNNAIVLSIGSAQNTNSWSVLTTPSGMENGFFVRSSSGSFGIGIASVLRTTAGAYDPASFGGGGGFGGSYCAATMALRPA